MIDLTKPLVTDCGCEVRVLCRDNGNTNFPVVGLVHMRDGTEELTRWDDDGVNEDYNRFNLINKPPSPPYKLMVGSSDYKEVHSVDEWVDDAFCLIEVVPEEKCVIINSFDGIKIIVNGKTSNQVKNDDVPETPSENAGDLLGGYLKSINGKIFDHQIE